MTAPAGHNSGTQGIAAGQLQSFIERIERLEEEKKGIAEDMKEVFAEAKANGFDPKVIRQVLKIRKMEKADRQEFEAMTNLYLSAVGEMPLGGGMAEYVEEATVSDLDMQNAYTAGKQAAESNLDATDNPYVRKDPRWQSWVDGYFKKIGETDFKKKAAGDD